MKKLSKTLVALTLGASLVACTNNASNNSSTAPAAGSDTVKGTYVANVTGDDWGMGVDKIVLTLDNAVDAVKAEDFTVVERKEQTQWAKEGMPIEEADYPRTVTAAYTCDESGAKTDGASKNVAIEMYISPNDGSPVNYDITTGFNSYVSYKLNIALAEGAAITSGGTAVTTFEIDPNMTAKTTNADQFVAGKKTVGGFDYNYVSYAPEGGADTVFVWLHGAGEGGSATLGDKTDAYIPVLCNRVTAFTEEKFQTAVGGAYVFAPQSPTYWMDAGDGTISGLRTNIYTESLAQLIDEYVAEVGASKVIISGCSNGGYMTMVLAADYGNKYTAYVPVCEALKDEYITDADIQKLKDLPLYFIYSEDDTTVDPTQYEIPTIKRLKDAGASNLEVSTCEHVTDLSGRFTNEDGTPYMYSGHWSWIYFDNNDTKSAESGISAFEWLGNIVK